MIVSVALTLGTVALVALASGGAMFSPGGLNAESRSTASSGVRSHADLAGNCAACHAPPWSGVTMAERCLACHAEVRRQIAEHAPMHGKLSETMSCRACHSEHNGPHGALTRLDRFDHDLATFPLTGKHRSLDCQSCHRDNAFRGTSQTCVSCHAEPKAHAGRFGVGCAQCHATTTWMGAEIGITAAFNHDTTGFKLTGKHGAVQCQSCHLGNRFKGTSQTCVSCHAEPKSHKGQFGLDCAKCHSTTIWKGAQFAHTFPLNHGRGRKSSTTSTCATCHAKESDFKSYTCYGCHAHTPERVARQHERRALATIEQCAKCHPTGREHERRRTAIDGMSIEVCRGCPTSAESLLDRLCGGNSK